jgi:hypothetical protein
MEDGLLVIKDTMTNENKHAELIVIPRIFSLSIMMLLHDGNHLSVKQIIKDSKRGLFIFNRKEVSKVIYERCLQCKLRRNVSPSLLTPQTRTQAERPEIHGDANILVRNGQQILLLRNSLTSYTLTKILLSEQKADLRKGLIELSGFLRTSEKRKTKNNILNDYGIVLEM